MIRFLLYSVTQSTYIYKLKRSCKPLNSSQKNIIVICSYMDFHTINNIKVENNFSNLSIKRKSPSPWMRLNTSPHSQQLNAGASYHAFPIVLNFLIN